MIAAWLKPNLALGFILLDIEQTVRGLLLRVLLDTQSPAARRLGRESNTFAPRRSLRPERA